jgi:hypothetical protein
MSISSEGNKKKRGRKLSHAGPRDTMARPDLLRAAARRLSSRGGRAYTAASAPSSGGSSGGRTGGGSNNSSNNFKNTTTTTKRRGGGQGDAMTSSGVLLRDYMHRCLYDRADGYFAQPEAPVGRVGYRSFGYRACIQNTVQLMTSRLVHVASRVTAGSDSPVRGKTSIDDAQYGPCNQSDSPGPGVE